MANIKSAIKRAKQDEKRRLRNKAVRTRVRSAVRRFLSIVEEGDAERAQAELVRVYSQLDRAAQKGVIHPNKAARRKARLAQRLNDLTA